jgi:hypothetical protein
MSDSSLIPSKAGAGTGFGAAAGMDAVDVVSWGGVGVGWGGVRVGVHHQLVPCAAAALPLALVLASLLTRAHTHARARVQSFAGGAPDPVPSSAQC